ncbi:MAG: hypothetical protein EVA89_17845 [Sandaracinaceae bacterium]|nr:MAG: hypothetical protein EVA89_17845 [Sandaracinaceae bacterium]
MALRLRCALVLLATLAASGCLPQRSIGHFADNGFYHTRDHYRVRYADGEASRGLVPGWDLVNFHHGEDGQPVQARSEPQWWSGYDLREYGVHRGRVTRAERWDLRFARGDDAIFSRTVPLKPSWASYDLPTLLRYAVHAIQARYAGAPDLLGTDEGMPGFVRVISEGDAVVDGRPARFITFDHQDRQSRQSARRVTLVAMRPGQHAWRVRRWRVPMLLVFGVVTEPGAHRESRADFEGLVSRVDVR